MKTTIEINTDNEVELSEILLKIADDLLNDKDVISKVYKNAYNKPIWCKIKMEEKI